MPGGGQAALKRRHSGCRGRELEIAGNRPLAQHSTICCAAHSAVGYGPPLRFGGVERLPAFADVALGFRVLVATKQQVLPNCLH
jgi:hypothetical protein